MVMNKMNAMNGQFNGNSFNNDPNPNSFNRNHLISNGKSVDSNQAFPINDSERIEQYKASQWDLLGFFFSFVSLFIPRVVYY